MSAMKKERRPRTRERALPIPGGRQPPHNIEMEQALLACCILDGGQESMTVCVEGKITADSFYKPAHQIIYSTLLELYKEGVAIDEIILADRLQSRGQLEEVGGHAYLMEITNRIDTPAHLPHYLERVRDCYLLREVVRISNQTIEEVYSGQEDIDHFIDSVEQRIFSLSETRIEDSARPLKDSIETAVAMVNQMVQNRGGLTGVSTGFKLLDEMTTGWHETEMIVVAARPSMGKTSLALNMAEAAILPPPGRKPVPTLMFSLEMGAEQLAMRLLCSRARVNMTKLREGFIAKEQLRDVSEAAKELKAAPLYIDDSSGLNILELRAKARRMANRLEHEGRLGLIIVDYLQLVAGTDPRVPREQQIAEISRGMKAMAKELKLPVIVLGQLNRESEKERRQPRLSDLRESGSIEQDADVVLLLSKPKDTDDDVDRSQDVVPRDLIIAKQRNGPVGTVPLHFIKNLTRFENATSHTA